MMISYIMAGDSKYIGYIDDLNIWYDEILKG